MILRDLRGALRDRPLPASGLRPSAPSPRFTGRGKEARSLDKCAPPRHTAPIVAEGETMPGPLAGVRVLELARILAGPWAGQVLADLGADVIKVERSKTGDDTRAWGPPVIEGKDGHLGAAYFHSTNRGKRSIECDFETDEGKRIVR